MSIWHTPGIESGNICGRTSPVPKRDRISADGSVMHNPGFTLTIPKNGILDTDKMNPVEVMQAEAVWGDDWQKKLDDYLTKFGRILGLAKGLPVKKAVSSEVPAEVEEKTAEYLKTTKVLSGARSASSVQ